MVNANETSHPEKISVAELQRLMRDPTYPEACLRGFFKEEPALSRAFHPGIAIDPERVDIAPPADMLEAAALMDWANTLSRQRRQAIFNWRLGFGDPRPVLVSEGDSWHQFPILLDDVIDQLGDDFNIWSVDAAGDTLQNMILDDPEYIRALERQAGRVRALLFSGGGNDILGEEGGRSVLARLLRPFASGQPAEWYLDTQAFRDKLQFVERCYRQALSAVATRFPGLPVICHGYDYAIPGGGPGDPRRPRHAAVDQWLARPLREDLGITDPALQRAIVRVLVERLNGVLETLCGATCPGGAFPNAWHVNVRGTLPDVSQWADELHPTDAGFAAVAERFRRVLASALDDHPPAPVLEGAFAAEMEAALLPEGESFVCDAAGEDEDIAPEAAFAAPTVSKPRVNRRFSTTYQSSRNGTRIDHIVIHYTTSRNIDGTISHFRDSTEDPTSAHYIVGRDGELVQMVADADNAWHAGKRAMNLRSIGIEHVAALGDEITPAQAATSLALIRWLMSTYGIRRENVIPHACVKSTSCCGDLFRSYGGGANKSCAVQGAALQRWLGANGIGGFAAAMPEAMALEAVGFAPLAAASAGQRLAMARIIVDFEARRDARGRIRVYRLPAADGGGRYEVAGINEHYHKRECDELVRLINAGQHAAAEEKAAEYIAAYTDDAARWCDVPAIAFYLRDCYFNRGPGGAARILQRAVGAAVDGQVGPQTLAAVARLKGDPEGLLGRLRMAREWYERTYTNRSEGHPFWPGLVSRWNKALAAARTFL